MPNNPEAERMLRELGMPVASDGTVELYHATTKTAADRIIADGALQASDGNVYLATHPAIASRISHPADGVVRLRAAVDDLFVHRRPDQVPSECPQAEFIVYPDGSTGD